jgi:hypothetical protein
MYRHLELRVGDVLVLKRGAPQRGTPVIRVGVRRAAAGGEPSQAGGQRSAGAPPAAATHSVKRAREQALAEDAAGDAAPAAKNPSLAPSAAAPAPAPLAGVNQLQPILQRAGVPPLEIVGFIAGFLRADAATQATALSLVVQAAGGGGGGGVGGGGAVRELVGAYAAAFPRPGAS